MKLLARCVLVAVTAVACAFSLAHAQSGDYQGSWDNACSPSLGIVFYAPRAAQVAPNGDVHVLGRNRIYRFTQSGACVNEWPVYSGTVQHTIWDMAVDSQGRLHVSDQGQNRVVVFGPDGDSLRTYGSAGTGPGQFNWSFSVGGGYVAVGPGDIVHVTDRGLARVTRFTAQGAYISHWSAVVGAEGGRVGSLAVDDSNHVFMIDQNLKRMMKFTSAGAFLLSWGGVGSGPGQFSGPGQDFGPEGVAVGPDGNVYVGDGYNHRIQVFDTMGQYLFEWGTAGSGPDQFGDNLTKVGFDALGNTYVADTDNSRVSKYGPGPVPSQRTTWGTLKTRYR